MPKLIDPKLKVEIYEGLEFPTTMAFLGIDNNILKICLYSTFQYFTIIGFFSFYLAFSNKPSYLSSLQSGLIPLARR
jgi:hypothetical protein